MTENEKPAKPYAMNVDNLRRRAVAVYLACDEGVAGDISAAMLWAADEIERLTPHPISFNCNFAPNGCDCTDWCKGRSAALAHRPQERDPA